MTAGPVRSGAPAPGLADFVRRWARFRAIFAGAATGIGIGDTTGRILEANQALLDMLGYSAAELRRRNVSDFVHPDDVESVWRTYRELIEGRRDHFRIEKRFTRSDGTLLWTHLSVSLIRDDDGVPCLQAAMMEDVTDRYRLQASLRHQALARPAHGAAQPGDVLRAAGRAVRRPCGRGPGRALRHRPRRLQGGQRQHRP